MAINSTLFIIKHNTGSVLEQIPLLVNVTYGISNSPIQLQPKQGDDTFFRYNIANETATFSIFQSDGQYGLDYWRSQVNQFNEYELSIDGEVVFSGEMMVTNVSMSGGVEESAKVNVSLRSKGE